MLLPGAVFTSSGGSPGRLLYQTASLDTDAITQGPPGVLDYAGFGMRTTTVFVVS